MKIPQELLGPIFELIQDPSTLVALSATSSEVQYEAERVLYREMMDHDPAIQLGFLLAIKRCPRRGGYVRAIQFYEPLLHKTLALRSKLGPGGYKSYLNDLRRHFPGALSNMVNLRELSLNVEWVNNRNVLYSNSGEPEDVSLNSLLAKMNACAFQLEAFECIGDLDYHLLSQFIERQGHLRRLSIRAKSKAIVSSVWPCGPSMIARPTLILLRGSKNILEAFLPTGNIRMLIWETTSWEAFVGVQESGIAQVKRFAPSLAAVQYLSLESDNPYFPFICPFLSNLERLQLAEFEGDLDTCVQLLNQIPSLRVLIIPRRLQPSNSAESDDDRPVQSILSRCPHITFVGDFVYQYQTYIYNVWDSRADSHQGPLTWMVPKSSLVHRHIFEILPFSSMSMS
ncbi:hypothetical protein CPC08DRAFT_704631 [Agrocybe pediades]|nr:hypothetical protein CPC08DRAFT_704631 [Agrocybe pediades]